MLSKTWGSKLVQCILGRGWVFKDLARFVFEVGCELAVACQPFGMSEVCLWTLSHSILQLCPT